jgi:hypothetical protein
MKKKTKAKTKVIQVRNGRARGGRPKVSRTRNDRVVWKNNDADRFQVSFSKWPFRGRRRRVSLPAGKRSASLTVSSKARKGVYRYALIRKRKAAAMGTRRVPPDPPGVSVGD